MGTVPTEYMQKTGGNNSKTTTKNPQKFMEDILGN